MSSDSTVGAGRPDSGGKKRVILPSLLYFRTAGPAGGGPIASPSPQRRQQLAVHLAAYRRYLHAPDKCGRHPRRLILPCGRGLRDCPNCGGPKLMHDGVAFALAHLAPAGPSSEYPGAVRHATAVHAAVAQLQQSLAPGDTWRVSDLATYGDGLSALRTSPSSTRPPGPACSTQLLAVTGAPASSTLCMAPRQKN